MTATRKTPPSTKRLSEVARHVVVPADIQTTGWPRVEQQLAEMGIRFKPWQEGIGKVALGKRANGLYAATIGGVTLSIPRQVGKTFLVGALIMALCIIFPGYTVLWTAHRTRTTTRTFQSLQRMAKRKKIAPHILSVRTANGEQEIAFRNGSTILFGAREQGFGRGFDEVDAEVFDEAQILTEKALEDMIAATNQSRHPHGALLFFMGTPPRPTDPGEAFGLKRKKALSGTARDMFYVEFSADRGADPDDHGQWAKANPSYPDLTPLESMLRLRENLPSDEAWLREALGIWDEMTSVKSVVTTERWASCAATVLPDQALAPTALGLDRWYDGSTAIAAAWRMESDTYVELVAVDVTTNTTAVVDWLVEQAGRSIPVVVASDSPAAALVPDLEARRVKVRVIAAGNYGKACVGFVDDVEDGNLTHASQEQLDDALGAATKLPIGKAGAWGWDRRSQELDISPLVAATLARFGAITKKVRTGESVFR